MTTVFEQLSLYCQAKGLPAPSKEDLAGVGNLISHHFRRYWGPKQFVLPGMIIPDTGFIIQQEQDGKHIVAGYPDIFKDEMMSRFDIYFENKAKQKQMEKKVETESKPPKAKPLYSAKPGNKK